MTGRPRAETPSMGAVHARLYTDRGRASDHLCKCGRRARDWAYQHGGEALVDAKTGRLYSTDLFDYAPMCRSCHFKLDAPKNPSWVESNRRNGLAGRGRSKTNPPTAEQLEILASARRKVASMRRRCSDCSLESSPAGVASHQNSTGHTGFVDLEKEPT